MVIEFDAKDDGAAQYIASTTEHHIIHERSREALFNDETKIPRTEVTLHRIAKGKKPVRLEMDEY
jgi:hypothetical protein